MSGGENIVYVKDYDYFQSLEYETFIYFKTKERAIRHREISCENYIKMYEEKIKEQQRILVKLNLLKEEKKPIEEKKPREKRKAKSTILTK